MKTTKKIMTAAAAVALSMAAFARTVDSPCYASEALSDPITDVEATAPCQIVSLVSYVYEPRIRTLAESPLIDFRTTPFTGLFMIVK